MERVAWLKKEISMSKARIAISVVILAAAVAATGVVGASVFPSASQSALDVEPMATQASSAKNTPEGDEEKLRTVSKDSVCDEITHPEAIQKVNRGPPSGPRIPAPCGPPIETPLSSIDSPADSAEDSPSFPVRVTCKSTHGTATWRESP